MQNFTGFYKKSIAGISCAFSILFLSHASFALESTALPNNQSVAAVTSSVAASENTVTSAAPAPAISTNASKPVPSAVKTNSASQLASLIGGLALILVLIYGLSWFVKRFSQGGFLHNSTIKIVSAVPLGTRERLMLVDVGGKQLLLGVTATQINALHVFEEPVAQAEKAQPTSSDFSQKLMAILQQKNIAPVDDSAQKKSNS